MTRQTEKPDYRKLTSPCGIDCFNCGMFHTNVTPELQQSFGARFGMNPADVSCGGCRITGCLLIPGACRTRQCAEQKGVEFCHECDSFPCNFLHPCSDKGAQYPHNMKMFNLCRIKAVGVEKWATEEVAGIRRRYYTGKLQIGSGPVLEE